MLLTSTEEIKNDRSKQDMEILKMYPENPTKKQMYDLTCNPNNQKMSL